jgi:hypothetical protein
MDSRELELEEARSEALAAAWQELVAAARTYYELGPKQKGFEIRFRFTPPDLFTARFESGLFSFETFTGPTPKDISSSKRLSS